LDRRVPLRSRRTGWGKSRRRSATARTVEMSVLRLVWRRACRFGLRPSNSPTLQLQHQTRQTDQRLVARSGESFPGVAVGHRARSQKPPWHEDAYASPHEIGSVLVRFLGALPKSASHERWLGRPDWDGLPIQQRSEKFAGVGPRVGGDLLRRSLSYHQAAA
jgi:hypothetical protein